MVISKTLFCFVMFCHVLSCLSCLSCWFVFLFFCFFVFFFLFLFLFLFFVYIVGSGGCGECGECGDGERMKECVLDDSRMAWACHRSGIRISMLPLSQVLIEL